MMLVFRIQQIGTSLLFEFLHVVDPACLYLVRALSVFNHFADIATTDKFLKERTEETVAHVQVAVRVDKIFEIYSFGNGLFFIE